MRSVEDMLLQLILQGDSITYHSATSRHHIAPHRVAPCYSHHHNARPQDVAAQVFIIVVHSAIAAPCLLLSQCTCCYPCFNMFLLSMI